MAFTFTDSGSPVLDDPPLIMMPHCDDGTDALNGIDVNLYEGTCNDLATATGGLLLDLSPFVVHIVNHESYGTLFQYVAYGAVAGNSVGEDRTAADADGHVRRMDTEPRSGWS